MLMASLSRMSSSRQQTVATELYALKVSHDEDGTAEHAFTLSDRRSAAPFDQPSPDLFSASWSSPVEGGSASRWLPGSPASGIAAVRVSRRPDRLFVTMCILAAPDLRNDDTVGRDRAAARTGCSIRIAWRRMLGMLRLSRAHQQKEQEFRPSRGATCKDRPDAGEDIGKPSSPLSEHVPEIPRRAPRPRRARTDSRRHEYHLATTRRIRLN